MEVAIGYEWIWQILYKFITKEVRMQVLKDLGGRFKEVRSGLENMQHV